MLLTWSSFHVRSLMFFFVLLAHLLAATGFNVLLWALSSVLLLSLQILNHPQFQLPCLQWWQAEVFPHPSLLSSAGMHSTGASSRPSLQLPPHPPAPIYSQPMCCYLLPLFTSSSLCAQNDFCFPPTPIPNFNFIVRNASGFTLFRIYSPTPKITSLSLGFFPSFLWPLPSVLTPTYRSTDQSNLKLCLLVRGPLWRDSSLKAGVESLSLHPQSQGGIV